MYETVLNGNQARVMEANGQFEPISASTIIDGFTIKNGNAGTGAGLNAMNCNATFRNLKIVNNTATIGMGAGVSLINSNSVFIQVVIANNTSLLTPGNDGDMAGMPIIGGSPKFFNSVIANNHAEGYTGGVGLFDTDAYFYNCIIYGNTADLVYSTSLNDNFMNGQDGVAYSSNCILEGCRGSDYLYENVQFATYGNDLGGNLDVNPLFNADYSLQTKAGINRGNTNAYLSAVNSLDKDYYNNNRIVDLIDIGLTEYQTAQPEILYVRQNATGDGSSWENASGDLQLMMDKQFAGKSIWVAEGTYYAPEPYFRLRDRIKIYGGFPSAGNPAWNNRNPELYPSVLTSAQSVIIGNFYAEDKKLSPETQVDGFVITKNDNSPVNMVGVFDNNSDAAYSNVIFRDLNYGVANIWNKSNVSFTDCRFLENNSLHDDYPTVFLHMGGRASFSGCDFIGNKAFLGSAMYMKNNSYVTIDNCEFRDNNRMERSGVGKLIIMENSSAMITNSVFDANGNNAFDGGILTISGVPDIYVPEWTHPVTVFVDRCVFKDNFNRAVLITGKTTDKISISNSLLYKNQGGVGGAVRRDGDGDFYLTNCTITQNYASNQYAGGMYFNYGNGNNHIRNSIIYNNTSFWAYGQEMWTNQTVRFQNSIVRTSGGSTNWNGGTFNDFNIAPLSIDMGGNLDADPLFADAANNDFHLNIGSPAVNSGANSFYNNGMIPDISSLLNDLDGTARILENVVDMGAYELNPDLGTNPFERTVRVSIHPNPADEMVYISTLDSIVREVKLFSVLGKEILSGQNDEVNVSSLPKGVYILKVTLNDNSSYSSKLVKK